MVSLASLRTCNGSHVTSNLNSSLTSLSICMKAERSLFVCFVGGATSGCEVIGWLAMLVAGVEFGLGGVVILSSGQAIKTTRRSAARATPPNKNIEGPAGF